MAIVIAVANQKGGCGKTTVTANLGIGLAMEGKKVCLIDADPQGSLTVSLGYQNPDNLKHTLAAIMMDIINEEDLPPDYGILHHVEGIDLIPANMELSGLEVSLSNVMSREMILNEYVDIIRDPGLMKTNFMPFTKASMAFVKMSMPERYGDLDKSSTAYAQLVTEDGLVKESGLYYDRSIHAKRSSVLSYNIENRKELWAKSCEYCGL